MEMDRIPTRDALRKRNINIEDSLCPLCRSEDESTEHVFTSCFIASTVWNGISSWCKIPSIFAFSIRDLLEYHTVLRGSDRKKEAVQGIIIIACRCLWRSRNKFMFSNSPIRMDIVISEVKALGFLWFSYRSRHKGIEWKDWISFVNM
ncbi:putative reverse transcriptase zinc-binding domain-containing protein [Helianthus anomalus]